MMEYIRKLNVIRDHLTQPISSGRKLKVPRHDTGPIGVKAREINAEVAERTISLLVYPWRPPWQLHLPVTNVTLLRKLKDNDDPTGGEPWSRATCKPTRTKDYLHGWVTEYSRLRYRAPFMCPLVANMKATGWATALQSWQRKWRPDRGRQTGPPTLTHHVVVLSDSRWVIQSLEQQKSLTDHDSLKTGWLL